MCAFIKFVQCQVDLDMHMPISTKIGSMMLFTLSLLHSDYPDEFRQRSCPARQLFEIGQRWLPVLLGSFSAHQRSLSYSNLLETESRL